MTRFPSLTEPEHDIPTIFQSRSPQFRGHEFQNLGDKDKMKYEKEITVQTHKFSFKVEKVREEEKKKISADAAEYDCAFSYQKSHRHKMIKPPIERKWSFCLTVSLLLFQRRKRDYTFSCCSGNETADFYSYLSVYFLREKNLLGHLKRNGLQYVKLGNHS